MCHCMTAGLKFTTGGQKDFWTGGGLFATTLMQDGQRSMGSCLRFQPLNLFEAKVKELSCLSFAESVSQQFFDDSNFPGI